MLSRKTKPVFSSMDGSPSSLGIKIQANINDENIRFDLAYIILSKINYKQSLIQNVCF